MMKAGFALLVDEQTHNFMRELALEIDRKYHTGLVAAQLPPHISLKQPFAISDLDGVTRYFDELAARLEPIAVVLKEVQVLLPPDNATPGVVWLDVAENVGLRNLHNRINRELAERFDNTAAPFDGERYRFHATVSYGGPPAIYPQIRSEYDRMPVGRHTRSDRICFFYSNDAEGKAGSYVIYRIRTV